MVTFVVMSVTLSMWWISHRHLKIATNKSCLQHLSSTSLPSNKLLAIMLLILILRNESLTFLRTEIYWILRHFRTRLLELVIISNWMKIFVWYEHLNNCTQRYNCSIKKNYWLKLARTKVYDILLNYGRFSTGRYAYAYFW